MRTGFTGAGLDRADHLRLDVERIAAMRVHAEARLLKLDALDPELAQDGRLAWASPADLSD